MRAAGFVPASGNEHGTRSSGGGGGGGSQATAHPVAPPPAPAKREPRDKSKRATLRMNWTVGTKGASGKRESVLSLVTAGGGPQPEKARTPRGTSSLRPQQPSVTASGGHRRGDGRGADDSGSGESSSGGDRRSNREDGKERKERGRGDDHSGGGDRKERKRGDANAVQAKSEATDAGDGENGRAKRSKDRGDRDAADTKPKREKKKEKKDEEDRGHRRRRNGGDHKKESTDESHKAVANDRKPAESDSDSDDDTDAGGGSSTGSAIVYSAEEAAQREAEEREALQREIGRVAVILAEAKEAVRHPASQGASATPTKTPVSQTMLHSDGFAPLRHRSDDTGLGMSASDSHVSPPSHQSRSASLSADRPPPGLSAAAESTDAAAMMMTSSATEHELGDRRESAAFARLLERQRRMGSSSTVGRANSRQIERPPLEQTEGALTPTRSSTVSKRHSRRRTLTAQELLDKYFAQQQQQQQAQQQQQRQTTNLIHHGKLGSATVGRTSRTNSVGMRKRPGLLVFPDSASELDGSSSPTSSGSMTATGGSSSLTSSTTDVYPAGGLRISSNGSSTPTATALRPASSLAQSQPSLRSLSDSLSAVATTVTVAADAGVDEAASPAAAVLSPRKRGDLRQMLRMSGERFIVPKPAGSDLARSRGKGGLMPRALLFVPPSPSVAAGKMTDSGDSTCRADDGDEDDDNDDSEESEEDDDDDEEEDDGEDDDDDDDDESSHEGDMTLETAIREQRLGAIAAVLRRLDAHNTGGGPRHRWRAASASASAAAATQLSRIPSLLVDDADGNPGPGGSPLHLAASLSPAHKRRDKVFEYLMNYGVKHRQRREDDDDEKAALLNNGGVGVGIAGGREAQLVVGRKRKQSYAVARRRAGLGGDDEEGDEDGSDDGDDGRPEGVVVDWERDEIPAWQWIDAPNREGDSALHVAVAKGFLFAVTKLLQDGLVDPDIVNMMGRTALHLACRWGRTDVCVTLLAAGATLDRVDDKGKTAYDLAAQHGHAECASLLMKEGADALLHYQCPPVPTSSQRYENKALAETTHDRFGWVVRETTRARAPPTTASGSSSSSSCNQSVSSSSNTVPTRASVRPKTASKRMELRDVRREKKWKEMLKRWDQAEAGRADRERPPKDLKFQKKLRQRVLKGIPNRLRGQVWARLAQTEELRARQGGSIFDPWRQGSKYIKQIDMDIEQTDRDHIFYRQRYGPKQRSLFAVLKAYSVHNPLVGYKQGLAQITSTILMYIDDEEEVFWILDSMIQSYGLEDLYKPDFPGLKKMFFLQDQLMRCFLPNLHDHFHKQSIRTSSYITKWVITMFRSLPFHVSMRVWDYFFYEGTIALITVSLALTSIFSGRLESLGFEGIMLMLNNMHKESINADRLIKTAVNLQAKIEKFDLIAKLSASYVSGRSESTASLNVARVLLKKRPREPPSAPTSTVAPVGSTTSSTPTAGATTTVSPRRLSDVRPFALAAAPAQISRSSFG